MAKQSPTLSPTSCPEGVSLSQWQIRLREQAAKKGGFVIADIPDKNVPGCFSVNNAKTRRNYRVIYHGIAVATAWTSAQTASEPASISRPWRNGSTAKDAPPTPRCLETRASTFATSVAEGCVSGPEIQIPRL